MLLVKCTWLTDCQHLFKCCSLGSLVIWCNQVCVNTMFPGLNIPAYLSQRSCKKNPKSYGTSQTLQSLVSMMLNFTATRKRLKKYSLSGKVSRRKLLSKKNMAAGFIQPCPLDRWDQRSKPNTAYINSANFNCQHRDDDLSLFCSHMTCAPCSHWVERELLCIPKYSRVKCQASYPLKLT